MTRSRQFIRSWSGGIISPELFGRLDDARYQQGADTIENFVCRMGGSLQRRPGWDFVRETKDSSKASRLIPFVYSRDDAYMLEVGDNYLRVFEAGGANPVLRFVAQATGGSAVRIGGPWTVDHEEWRRYEVVMDAVPGGVSLWGLADIAGDVFAGVANIAVGSTDELRVSELILGYGVSYG